MRSSISSVSATSLGVPGPNLRPAEIEVTPEVIIRRQKQQRLVLDMAGLSFAIDAAILLIYAHAGTTSYLIGSTYGLCGLLAVAGFIIISDPTIADRFGDHYLVELQARSACRSCWCSPTSPGSRLPVPLLDLHCHTFAAIRSNASNHHRMDERRHRPDGAVYADRQAHRTAG